MKDNEQIGFSILELLIALACMALLLALSVPTIQMMRSIHSQQLNKEREEQILTTAANFYNSALVQANTFYGLPPAYVHSQGTLRLSTDREFVLRHPVDRNSNAISFLRVNMQVILQALSKTSKSSLFCLGSLHSNGNRPAHAIHNTTLWIGAGVDGPMFFNGELRRQRHSTVRCPPSRLFRGRLSHSEHQSFFNMNGQSTRLATRHIAVVMPVTEFYSLYLDNKGTLRRYDHIRQSSQPILDGLGRIQITETKVSDTTQIEIEFTVGRTKPRKKNLLAKYRYTTASLLNIAL